MDFRQQITSIITSREKKHCAVATVSASGAPECAVVGYSVLDNLALLINTDSTSRKWLNLQKNPHVAVAIGWTAQEPFIQYEGIATFVGQDHKGYTQYEELFFRDHPNSVGFKGTSKSVFIVIRPTWIRLVDTTVSPSRREEIVI